MGFLFCFLCRLLFRDLCFQHTELHFEHILQSCWKWLWRAIARFLLGETFRACRGLEGPLRDASPTLHLAQAHCNADVGTEVCKDTLVPVLCLGCLPLAQIGVLQPLTFTCGNLRHSQEIFFCRTCCCCMSVSHTSLSMPTSTPGLQIMC